MQNFACTSNQFSTAAQLIMFPAIDESRLKYSVTACFSSLHTHIQTNKQTECSVTLRSQMIPNRQIHSTTAATTTG